MSPVSVVFHLTFQIMLLLALFIPPVMGDGRASRWDKGVTQAESVAMVQGLLPIQEWLSRTPPFVGLSSNNTGRILDLNLFMIEIGNFRELTISKGPWGIRVYWPKTMNFNSSDVSHTGVFFSIAAELRERFERGDLHYPSYPEARDIAGRLLLLSQEDWDSLKAKNFLPVNIPSEPDAYYRNSGWEDWTSFLKIRFSALLPYSQELGISDVDRFKAYFGDLDPTLYPEWVSWEHLFERDPKRREFLEVMDYARTFVPKTSVDVADLIEEWRLRAIQLKEIKIGERNLTLPPRPFAVYKKYFVNPGNPRDWETAFYRHFFGLDDSIRVKGNCDKALSGVLKGD